LNLRWETLGHRTRLTIVAGLTAGVLFALAFGGVVLAVQKADSEAVYSTLRGAVERARIESETMNGPPDLDEIAGPNLELSLAEYRLNGQLIQAVGSLHIPFETPSGTASVNKVPVLAQTVQTRNVRILGAIPLAQHSIFIRRLSTMLLLLWGPLSAVAALAVFYSAKAAFRPLEEMAAQAEAMAAGRLSSRIVRQGSDEYADFANRLNGLLERIEDSVSRQERFIQDAAHELRTPLTVLRGRIETTLRRERTPFEYQNSLRTCLDESERLSTLVDALLTSALPVDSDVKSIDLDLVVERAHARWVDRFEARYVRLETDIKPARAKILEPEIDVVLDNLLANALRASPPNSTCAIQLENLAGKASLTVLDEGEGIPEDLLSRVFDRFSRADSNRTRTDGGFGIGLAVCKRLVESRGGTISVTSSPSGSTFTIAF
jgi:two-component system, OmpR family, sensor kinase